MLIPFGMTSSSFYYILATPTPLHVVQGDLIVDPTPLHLLQAIYMVIGPYLYEIVPLPPHG